MGDRYNSSSEENVVYVGKLDYKATEDDLRDVFDKYGPVTDGVWIFLFLRQKYASRYCNVIKHVQLLPIALVSTIQWTWI